MLRLLLPATFGLVALGGLATIQVNINRYLHPARVVFEGTPAAHGLRASDVTLTTEDGLSLAAWLIPGTGTEAVILVHGIGGSRGALLPLAADLHARGYSLCLFDLRAQGQSGGTTSTLGAKEVRDVAAALAFLREQPGVDPGKIGIYGQSLGGVTALLATAKMPELRAVVADSPFASARWLVHNQFRRVVNLPSWLGPLVLRFGAWQAGISANELAPLDTISRISPRPLLLIQGDTDRLIDIENAHLLYDAAGEPKTLWKLPAVGHIGGYAVDPVAYASRVDAFFQEAFSDALPA